MKPPTFKAGARWFGLLGAVAAASALSVWAAQDAATAPARDRWSKEEIATIASMRLQQADRRPADPSNAYEQRTEAATLGRALFNDTRLSRNGQVACASCHAADKQFQDGKQFGQGIATGKRRTMPVMGAAHAPFPVLGRPQGQPVVAGAGPAGGPGGARRQSGPVRPAGA
jgi:cytochrome c peroxidase